VDSDPPLPGWLTLVGTDGAGPPVNRGGDRQSPPPEDALGAQKFRWERSVAQSSVPRYVPLTRARCNAARVVIVSRRGGPPGPWPWGTVDVVAGILTHGKVVFDHQNRDSASSWRRDGLQAPGQSSPGVDPGQRLVQEGPCGVRPSGKNRGEFPASRLPQLPASKPHDTHAGRPYLHIGFLRGPLSVRVPCAFLQRAGAERMPANIAARGWFQSRRPAHVSMRVKGAAFPREDWKDREQRPRRLIIGHGE